jgi:hypothetical protein
MKMKMTMPHFQKAKNKIKKSKLQTFRHTPLIKITLNRIKIGLILGLKVKKEKGK